MTHFDIVVIGAGFIGRIHGLANAYVATGYSKLDYVLTARILKHSPVQLAWHNISFGGKGTETHLAPLGGEPSWWPNWGEDQGAGVLRLRCDQLGGHDPKMGGAVAVV